MARRIIGFTFLVILFALSGAGGRNVATSHQVLAQTIPSRTPTPAGSGATATQDSDDPGPNPTVLPTSTSRPAQATATSTLAPLPPTPEDGFLPTALPCGLEPTIRSISSGLNIRSGPGLSYRIVGSLLLQEVRPIIGRAPHNEWWQITLADGNEGWIADSVVEVSGYVDNVPVVEPPPLENGATVTPGTPWAPTPRPDCTPPPTTTGTPSPTPETTPTFTLTADTSVTEEPEDETPTGTSTLAPTGPSNESATVTRVAPTAEPLPEEDEPASTAWIPLLGAGLILAAAGIYAARRLRR